MVLTDDRTFSGSILERFAATNPGREIWWDSSPLVFETWRSQMLDAAAPDRRWELAEELLRLWDPEHPAATLYGSMLLADDPVHIRFAYPHCCGPTADPGP